MATEMIELKVPDEIVALAEKYSANLGIVEGSIEEGEGNVAGFVGKLMVTRYLNLDFLFKKDYDFKYGGKRCRVHTKRTTRKPLPKYACTVEETALFTHQCDYYVFCRTTYDYKMLWVLGCFSVDDYKKESKRLTPGEHEGNNGFKVLAPCYNLPVSSLFPFGKILDLPEREQGQAPLFW